MKKLIGLILTILFVLSASVPAALAQEEEEEFFILDEGGLEQEPSGNANCFDYYQFGSIQMDIGAQSREFSAGQPASFSGQLKNANAYPVFGGALFARIVRKDIDEQRQRVYGGQVVDEFFVKEGIALDGEASQNISFAWSIPSQAPEGQYQAQLFFNVDKRFNLSGLPFTNEILGGSINFKVKSGTDEDFYFDRTKTKVNGKDYAHIGNWPSFSAGSQVTISQPLVNATSETKTFDIVYELYWWDTLREQDRIKSSSEKVTLAPGASQTLSYQIDALSLPVTALKIKASSQGQQVAVNLRVTSPTEKPRLNYFGLTEFPIKAGQAVKIFACVHNTSYIDTEGQVKAQILDKKNQVIDTLDYTGRISSAMMGLAKDVSASKSLDYLKLKAELFDKDGKLVDSSEIVYDCSLLPGDVCQKSSFVYALLGILVLVILVIVILLVKGGKSKNKEALKALLLLFVGFSALAGLLWLEAREPEPGRAKAGEFQAEHTEPQSQFYSYKAKMNTFRLVIKSGWLEIRHRVSVDKESPELEVGDFIKFIYNPDDPSFTAVAGAWDTPYGRWIKGKPSVFYKEYGDDYLRQDHQTSFWHDMEWDKDYTSSFMMECPSENRRSIVVRGETYQYCGAKEGDKHYSGCGDNLCYHGNFWQMSGISFESEWQDLYDEYDIMGKKGAASWGCWKPEIEIVSSDNSALALTADPMIFEAKKIADEVTVTFKIKPTTCRIFVNIESKKWVYDEPKKRALPFLWWPSDVKDLKKNLEYGLLEPHLEESTNLMQVPSGGGDVRFTWTFTIGEKKLDNSPPKAFDCTFDTTQDTAVMIDVKPYVSDPDGDPVKYLVDTQPSHCSPLIDTNKFATLGTHYYRPITGFVGTDFFTFYAKEDTSENKSSNIATCTINVSASANNPPEARNVKTIACSDWCKVGCAGPTANNVFFSWDFYDPDAGDTQDAYRIQVARSATFADDSLLLDTGWVNGSSSSHNYISLLPADPDFIKPDLNYDQTYYWRVKVRDNRAKEALDWAGYYNPASGEESSRYIPPRNPYPGVKFVWSPREVKAGIANPVTFTSRSTFYDGMGDESHSWKWNIPGANFIGGIDNQKEVQVYFPLKTTYYASLTVRDVNNYSCVFTAPISVSKYVPWWREIWPF